MKKNVKSTFKFAKKDKVFKPKEKVKVPIILINLDVVLWLLHPSKPLKAPKLQCEVLAFVNLHQNACLFPVIIEASAEICR